MMNKRHKDCFDVLVNLDAAEERVQTAMAAYSRYASYWTLHNKVREQDPKELESCPELLRQVAERAVDGERDLRILLKEGIDAVNEVADSGRLESVIEKANDFFTKHSLADLENGLRAAQKGLAKRYPAADLSFLDSAFDLLKKNVESLQVEKGNITVTYKAGDKKTERVVIEAKPRPGQVGRFSARDFFGRPITASVPVYVPADCHHRTQTATDNDLGKILDVYGSLLGGFAAAKESAYRHVRKVNEIGITRRRGNDPITAIIVIVAAVAAALVIAGVVIEVGCAAGAWSGDVCDWGWGFIVAGIILGGILCVAAGACDLVINGIVVIAA
jgi:hypothetical protein